VWESACLRELGRAVVSFIAQQALTQVRVLCAQLGVQANNELGPARRAPLCMARVDTPTRTHAQPPVRSWSLRSTPQTHNHTTTQPHNCTRARAQAQVAQKSIQTFLYTGLVGALALPMTLTTAMRVAFGSSWLVALRRAQAAGRMLAMQLAQVCARVASVACARAGVPADTHASLGSRPHTGAHATRAATLATGAHTQGCHGGRPMTLIGCSMGARLIFHCLLELGRLGLKGCVENVILLGAPLSCRCARARSTHAAAPAAGVLLTAVRARTRRARVRVLPQQQQHNTRTGSGAGPSSAPARRRRHRRRRGAP
jgi:hypothetical protein